MLLWTSERNILPNNPLPEQVAQYLAYPHRKRHLAASTVKLYKSVIAAFSNLLKREAITNNPLVKHILKAIGMSKLKIKKTSIWSVNALTEWIKRKTMDKNNLFQVSTYTALILLLAESRTLLCFYGAGYRLYLLLARIWDKNRQEFPSSISMEAL